MTKRQAKDVSIALWEMEKDLSRAKASEAWSELYKILDPKIRDYTVTYEEFVTSIINKMKNFKDTDDRKTQVSNMLKELIDEYRD